MKRILLALAITVMISCDNPVSKKVKETKENVENTNNAIKEMNNMQEDIEALKEVTPLTNDELKAWLPDEVNGMKRISYKAGQASFMKIASLEATYANEDKSKTFKVTIMDGAGEMGAAATAGVRILFSQDFEEESETKTRRTAKRDGMKVIEEYWKDRNNSSIQLMQNDRFYIKADGKNMNLDETWNAIEDMDANDLS